MRRLPILLLLFLAGCFGFRGSSGGGQIKPPAPATTRPVNPADVALPAGYRIDVVATDLTFPTGVAFDDQNRPYVVEAGYSYGEVFTTPRLVRIEPDGHTTEIARGSDNGPWTGVTYHKGSFYVAEGGVRRGGAILRISPDGQITKLIENLPTRGDHHTNAPTIGPDGALYFGVGSATNSGVVGLDNADFGWLDRDPKFHDIPAKDIKLIGQNFVTRNPLTPDRAADATTGAFVPFGTATQAGHVIKGEMPCNGAILRIPLPGDKNTTMEDGRWRMDKDKPQYASSSRDPAPSSILHPPSSSSSSPQLVAWGLRNPFALAFAPDGRLFCAENSYDVRGSRPVYGTGDVLWQIATDAAPLWYGFPDFHAGRPLTWSDHFQAPGQPAPQFLLAEHPNPVPKPAAILPVHGSYCGFDFSRSGSQGDFGFPGNLFIAAFGDMAPAVGKVLAPVGFRVDRVDPNAGVIESFAVNRGKENGPASKLGTGGLERPIAARFDNTQSALYVVDFGILTMDGKKPHPIEKTGVLWRITREGAR